MCPHKRGNYRGTSSFCNTTDSSLPTWLLLWRLVGCTAFQHNAHSFGIRCLQEHVNQSLAIDIYEVLTLVFDTSWEQVADHLHFMYNLLLKHNKGRVANKEQKSDSIHKHMFSYPIPPRMEILLSRKQAIKLTFLPPLIQPHFSQSLGRGTVSTTYTPLSCCFPTGQSLLSPWSHIFHTKKKFSLELRLSEYTEETYKTINQHLTTFDRDKL